MRSGIIMAGLVVLAGCAPGGAPRAVDARLGYEALVVRLDDGMRCTIARSASTGRSDLCGGVSWQIDERPGLLQTATRGTPADRLIAPSAIITVTSADGVARRFEVPDHSRIWKGDSPFR